MIRWQPRPVISAALFGIVVAVASATPAFAQFAQATPSVPAPDAQTMPAATRGQPVTIEVGTGVLLPLPRPAATVLSAEPAIARVQPASPTSLFLMGVASGHTTIVALTDQGNPITQYDVTVVGGAAHGAPATPAPVAATAEGTGVAITAQTAAQIEAAIHRMVSGAIGVRASAAGGRIVLTGSVPTPAAAQQASAVARGYAGEKAIIVADFVVLSAIQVNVRVRIAEISRTIERQLGFNWQTLGSGKIKFGLLTGAGASPNSTISGIAANGLAVSSLPYSLIDPRLPLGLPSSPDQVGFGYASGKYDVNGIIDALATDQLVTILAEPNLTAQSGEPASFLAGGEFPIPVAGTTSNGSTTVTVVFKQFGVSLEVVPTVLSAGRINLRVRPEVSQLSNVGAVSVPVSGGTLTIPALTVRRAETTVELGSGQSFAIAGLLQKTTSDSSTGLPGASELPVIGALFKSTDFQRGESELVIIVTPYLVKPAPSPDAFRLPTDGYHPATDLDRILLGRQLAQPSGAPIDAGFILK